MFSKSFVAYIAVALAIVPSLSANPIIPPESAANASLTPATANVRRSNEPSSSSNTLNVTVDADAAHNPAPTSSLSTAGNSPINARDTNLASPANALASAPNPASTENTFHATNTSGAPAGHGSSSDSSPHATSTPKALASNSTAAPGGSEKDVHVKSMPVATHGPDAEPKLTLVPTCHNKKRSNGVETHHCEKALDKVVYAANQTLDKFSSFVFANYKTCNLNVYKPKNATLTKKQVEAMVHNVTEACHSVGGVLFKTSKIVVKVDRGKAENTYDLDAPVCKKEQCPLTQGDCLSAFYQIPFDRKGGLTSKISAQSISRVTSGNCTVTISTTDYSNIDITRQNAYPAMKKLFNECGRHPGKIYVPGGSYGFNGDLKISTRSSNLELCD